MVAVERHLDAVLTLGKYTCGYQFARSGHFILYFSLYFFYFPIVAREGNYQILRLELFLNPNLKPSVAMIKTLN